nr:hypothetical protein [Blautia obeum]
MNYDRMNVNCVRMNVIHDCCGYLNGENYDCYVIDVTNENYVIDALHKYFHQPALLPE